MKHIFNTNTTSAIELTFWVGALCLLSITDPSSTPLIELCPFKALGIWTCPGCGMGHAIAFLLDGEFAAAVAEHPLAPFALAGIAGRGLCLARDAVESRKLTP